MTGIRVPALQFAVAHGRKAIAFAVFSVALFSSCRAADTALIEAARREGRVVWYTTLIVNQAIRPLKEAFEKRFPGIELQYVRADEAPTAAKIMAESSTGHVAADIFDGISNMVPLKRATIAAPYRPAAPDAYPSDLKDKDTYWHAILLYVFAPGVNTTLVPLEAAPKSYQDLLAPKWRAKMAWNPSSVAGAIGFVGNVLISMGETSGRDYLAQLSKQQIINIEASSRAILDQVIAGEFPIGLMMFNHHTVISAQRGAPTDWLKLEPVPIAFDAVGILKDAPHPNAARLLVEFLTSEEGQRVLQRADYLPAMPGVAAMKPGLRPQDGGFKATFLRPDEIYERIPRWTETVKELFR
jgi:iron(III) transport system substrate-binding protein